MRGWRQELRQLVVTKPAATIQRYATLKPPWLYLGPIELDLLLLPTNYVHPADAGELELVSSEFVVYISTRQHGPGLLAPGPEIDWLVCIKRVDIQDMFQDM